MPSSPDPSSTDDLPGEISPRGGPFGRRRALALLAGAGATAVLAACGSGGSESGQASTTSTSAAGGTGGSGGSGSADAGDSDTGGDAIPEETAGPFPGDGTNGPNVLTEDGVVRRDIRSSIGSASGTAGGVPLDIELTVLDAASGDPLPGVAVYVWHCDREGRYSLYSDGVEGENYLRGVQAADADGRLSFTSTFPGAYPGRWPHIHFEVYADVAEATSAGTPVATSQLAFPEETCDEVYATGGYEQSAANMTRTPLESDMVFSDDGAVEQMAAMSGSVSGGLVAALDVPV